MTNLVDQPAAPAFRFDRYGNMRNLGYRREEHQLCFWCPPPPGIPSPTCSCCGGYGEISIVRPLNQLSAQ